MDDPWIEFQKWPHEPEMFHFTFGACDSGYVATQEFYANVSDVEAFGMALEAFPSSLRHEVHFEVGKRDPAWAHWISLRAYLYDAAGHAAFEVDTCNNTRDPWRREARFTIRCEVASLNRFGTTLREWVRRTDRRMRAELTGVDG
jgi:hypothetical protein